MFGKNKRMKSPGGPTTVATAKKPKQCEMIRSSQMYHPINDLYDQGVETCKFRIVFLDKVPLVLPVCFVEIKIDST